MPSRSGAFLLFTWLVAACPAISQQFSFGQPDIKYVSCLTFFPREINPAGAPYHSFVRSIIRGNRILYTR